MHTLAGRPTPLLFHAEMIPPVTASVGDDVQRSLPPLAPSGPLTCYRTFLDSRPPAFETYAVAEILSLAEAMPPDLPPRPPLHIVHLSAAECVPLLRAARERGVRVTAETCFHYLSLAAEGVAEGDTRHKCCPPIRSERNRDALWRELLSGEEACVRTVVSDHSPCTPGMKLLPVGVAGAPPVPLPGENGAGGGADEEKGNFFAAWGGVSSVGLGLSILWTERGKGGSGRDFDILDVVRWCSSNTAAQAGLSHCKGELGVGMDADVAVFDDEAELAVRPDTMLFRNKCSPYEGKRLRGRVVETWLAGRRVYSSKEGLAEDVGPTGKLLTEKRTA